MTAGVVRPELCLYRTTEKWGAHRVRGEVSTHPDGIPYVTTECGETRFIVAPFALATAVPPGWSDCLACWSAVWPWSSDRKVVVSAVAAERDRQNELWGVQNHPDGTGAPGDREAADTARVACNTAHAAGADTWRLILAEEVAEAFAESDPEALMTELVQVSAVAQQWYEAILRRVHAEDATRPAPPLPRNGWYRP